MSKNVKPEPSLNDDLQKAADLLRSGDVAYVWERIRNPRWMYVESDDETIDNLDRLIQHSWNGLVEILNRNGYFELKSMLKALDRHKSDIENTIKDLWDRLCYQQKMFKECSREAENTVLSHLSRML